MDVGFLGGVAKFRHWVVRCWGTTQNKSKLVNLNCATLKEVIVKVFNSLIRIKFRLVGRKLWMLEVWGV